LALAQAGTVRETEFYNFQNGFSPRGGLTITYCGQNDENGVIYHSPAALATIAVPALGDVICDGLDGATEGAQDLVTSNNVAFRPLFMKCSTAAVLAAAETMAFQLRAAEASVPGFACTIATGETTCDVAPVPRFIVPRAVPHTMRVTQVSDNADDDAKCIVNYGIH
jgi:hypothetical protein